MDDSKRSFKLTKDGQEIELFVRNPTLAEREQAESIRMKAWNQAVRDRCIFAEKLNDVLKEQNIWSDEKEAKQQELQEELIESITKIKRGGIKLQEARQLAIRIRQIRNELNLLTMDRVRYVDECVEGISQNKEFGFMVSQTVVYDKERNKKYFASYEDYLNRSRDIDTYLCSNKCSEVFYGVSDVSSWPENNFLRKYKFVDDKLRLINEDGHLVNLDGRLINEDGDYVADVDGKEVVIDKDGNVLTEESAEPAPFLNDNGEPIVEQTKEEVTPVEQVAAI